MQTQLKEVTENQSPSSFETSKTVTAQGNKVVILFYSIGLYSRFIVRIDSWETNSLYPNGHFVKSLGTAGHIETEISALLVEHGLLVVPFSGNITNEMPTNSKDQPWKMEEAELKRRRDLR